MNPLNDPHPTWTLEHAKIWLRERFYAGEATPCPCCNQTVKLYARKLGPSMASALLTLYRHAGTEYASIIDLWSRLEQADGPKLRYWGLIEPHKTEARPSGEVAVGFSAEASLSPAPHLRRVVSGDTGPGCVCQDATRTTNSQVRSVRFVTAT